MIENERRFLCTKLPTRQPDEIIQQGYIMVENDRHLRVRIINDDQAFICCKVDISKTAKFEFEYEIPKKDGKELLNLSTWKLTKMRWKVEYKGQSIDIDLYSTGLMVAEIEFKGNIDPILPDYFGREITGEKEYTNIQLAKNAGNEPHA